MSCALSHYLNRLPSNVITYLRSCIHTQRCQGYINKFPVNSDHSIGFIVSNDEPNKEYIFHIDDIHSEDIKLVRQYQSIEFDIMDGKPYKKAKQITAPSKQLLKYNHENSSIDFQLYTQRLSQIPNAFNQRFTGIVHSVNSNDNNGFITPDRLYCDLVYFDSSEIHCTGIGRLKRNDAVSFYVTNGYNLSNILYKNRKDVALSVRRVDNGLITVEDFELGNHRRMLGEIYDKDQQIANIPSEYLNNRYGGYIIHRQKDGLLGYIFLFDDKFMEGELISIHVDDCHMYGNRKLRRFEEIEFCIQLNNEMDSLRCKYKAVQVTEPDLYVMSYNKDNYLFNTMKNNEFKENNEMGRFKGIISDIKEWNEGESNLYEITPNMNGYKPIFGYQSELRVVGNKALQIGDAVEFHIDYQTQKPFHITAEGGYPFICEYSNSDYSKYIRGKYKLSTFRRDFALYSNNYGEGFISSFNVQNQCGTIEIIAANDIRYRQILFHLKDVDTQLGTLKNQKVLFEVIEMDTISGSNNVEFISFIRRDDLDLTKRAINIKLFEHNTKYNDFEQKTESNTRNAYLNERDTKLTKINKILQQKMSYLRY